MFDAPVNVPVAFHVPSQISPPVDVTFQRDSFSFSAYAPHGPEYLRSNSRTHRGQQLAQSTVDMMVAHPPGIPMSQGVPYGSQTMAAPGMDYYPVPSSTQIPHQPSGRGAPSHPAYQREVSDSSRLRPQQHVPLPSSSITLPDIMQSFPLDTEDHRLKRESLNLILHSTWRQNNEFEPEASLLLQFMSWDPTEKKFHCLFWKDGQPCPCSCRSRDHAKGHIRSHLDLVPFVCDSRW